MPKNSPEVVFKPLCFGENASFFAVLRGILCLEACIFFRKELRFPNPVHLAMDTRQKPRIITRKSQLFTKKDAGL